MAKVKSEIGIKTGAMTLFEAKNKAKEYTLAHKDKKMYVLVSEANGDCSVSFNPNVPNHETHHCYKNGSEIAIETVSVTSTNKIPKGVKQEKESMETVEKVAAKGKASKSAKKSKPAKKAAKKSVAKKASAPAKAIKLGKKQTMKVADLIKAIKGGKEFFNVKSGRKVNLAILQKKVNGDITREVQQIEK